MTKQANKTAKKHNESVPLPFAGMAGLNEGSFETYAQANQALLESAFALNQELMQFVGERFQADMAAFQALSQCTNGQDMAAVQSDLARSAAEAYQAEVSKLMEQGMATTTVMWKPFHNLAESLSKSMTQD